MTADRPVVVVTGSCGALGQALRHRLAPTRTVVGFDLEAHDSDDARAVDVTSEASVAAAFAWVVEHHGAPSELVNAAGIVARGPTTELAVADWRAVLDINVTGTFLVAREFAKVRAPSAAIVNVSSIRGIGSMTGGLAYSASKAAVAHMTKVLAREWGPAGCRVNAVAPSVFPDGGQAAELTASTAYVEAKVQRIPLGRLATMDEMVATVEFLLSPAAGFINGAVVPIDGGETC